VLIRKFRASKSPTFHILTVVSKLKNRPLMERPFDARLRLVYETLEKTKENFIFNFSQNDKILVWIVGFVSSP
jgi:hypothetical protein